VQVFTTKAQVCARTEAKLHWPKLRRDSARSASTDLLQVPKLRRKSEVETQVVRLVEESKAATFEHLQIFPSPGEQRSSGGGATTTVRSGAGRDLDHQIRVQDEEGTR
jgi:hypothetical protein